MVTGDWPQGFFSLGMVGAYNVGSIALANNQDCDLRTNRMEWNAGLGRKGVGRGRNNYFFRKQYAPEVSVRPGEAFGTFHVSE